MTVIDRQKYVAELGKLLSGMAPQDREAVLRGVNARFDEEGDDAAVIASLGSPTFAAVSVLRGYTPPEEGASDSVPMPEPRRARPEPKPVEPKPIEPEPEEPAAPEEAEPEEPEAESAEADEPSPVEPVPEAESTEPAEPAPEPETAPPAEPETEPEPEQPEIPAEPAEPETAEEPAEAEAPEDASEPAEESEEPDEPEEPGTEAEEPAESDEAVEPEEAEENPELPPFWGGPPELPKPPKAKVGLLILYIILGVAVGLPLTVLFACVALGIFGCGGALIAAAALLVSFCFLGMSVVADILLLAGAALVLAALGLLLLFFAVWFFIRCVVGFVNLILRKGREWCYDHGEVDA